MKKKGISPLIATVLILGFTVALAAVIMTWGTGFTKKMQETTEETSDIQIMCATDVLFDIKSACETATDGTYKITIANNGNIDIDEFQVRYYEGPNIVQAKSVKFDVTTAAGILKFGLEYDDKVASGLSNVKMVEAIPIITIGGKSITCVQTIDTFGSLTGDIIGSCT